MWEGSEDGLPRLFLNDTEGAFVDITNSSGVGVDSAYWQTFMHDLSADGYPDIFTNEDNLSGGGPGRSHLWINQQNKHLHRWGPTRRASTPTSTRWG